MSFIAGVRAGWGWFAARVLAHSWTGWAFFLALGLLAGAWVRYDYVVDKLEACLASRPTAAEESFAERLKDRNDAQLEESLDDLDSASSECLDGVYDPDQAARDRLLRDTGEG